MVGTLSRRSALLSRFAVLLGLLLGLGVFVATSFGAEEEKGVLAGFISRALSTPESRVTIGTIDGALSSKTTIHDIQIQDRDGVWLKLNRVRISWNRLALLSRRLEIDDLDLEQLTVLRKPVPAETPVAGEQQPLLPDLPVKVEVKQFALAELVLGAPILGTPARFSAGGYGTLGAPSEGLELHLDGQRLDRPASLTVRMTLVPEGQKLNLAVALDEPAGGIVSEIANIPGRPPVKLTIGGQGTLDAFQAKLAFDAGPDIGAEGTTTLHRDGAGRQLGLDLAARVGGMLPSAAAPVFAGTTKLTGTVRFGDDRAVTIPSIALVAAAARLDVTGTIDATQIADLHVTATNVPNQASDTAVAQASIKRLALDTHVTGALASPTVDATLQAEDVRVPSGALGRLEASFKAVPTGPVSDLTTRLRVSADAKATGLALANPSLAQAIGTEATFTLRGTTGLNGAFDIDDLALKAQTLAMSFKGQAGSSELAGHLALDAPDLSRFGAGAGLGLKGGATATAEIEGTPRSNRFTAKLDARTTRLATGIAPIDGLFGGATALTGGLRIDPDGGFGFEDLAVTGPNAAAKLNGAATPAAADVTALLGIPDLAKADARLSGHGDLSGHLGGTLDHPDATALLTIENAAMLGRPVPHLTVQVDAKGLRDTPDAHLTLDGTIDRKAARGTLHVARRPDGGTNLDGLDIAIGSVTVQGGLSLDAAALATGRVAIRAGDLNDLSAPALQKLSGALDADATFTGINGRQDASLKASGRTIAGFGVAVDRLVADLTATDLTHHPALTGTAAIDQAQVHGETISRIRLASQAVAGSSDVSIAATARGFDLQARARLAPTTPLRIELSKLEAARGASRIALAGPTTLVLRDGGVDLHDFALALGSGRLTLDGSAGSRLSLKAVARAIPLATADLAMPGLAATGTLDGDAAVAGSLSAPTGDYKVRIAGLAVAQTRSAGLPALDINANGRLDGTRATLDATILAGAAGTLKVAGNLPLGGGGALDLGVRGTLDAAIANRTISAGGRRVTGSVALDARLAGTFAHPLASGSAALSDGSFQDAGAGVKLDAIRARLVAHGDDVTIEGASATTRNGGTITASGHVKLDPSAGFPGLIRVDGQRAQLVQSTLATAVANLDLTMSGPLARDPRLGGRVDILSLEIPVPDRLPGNLQPLAGTRHLRPTPTAQRRLALDAKGRRGGKTAPAFDAALDIAVAVPGYIHVYGRGLDTRLGGGLKLTGTLANPRPVGAFHLVTGRLRILTSQLDFTRANLTFAGDLSPELDFLATTQAASASINIAITGSAADPQFAFTSSPDLPQDEILSRLLFGVPAGQLSPTQALSLAQAAAIYSGGNGALEGLRRSLGLGDASRSGNPLTNALGDRVSIGIRTGATPAQTGVGMDVSLTRQFKLKGAVDAKGGSSVGIGAEHEW